MLIFNVEFGKHGGMLVNPTKNLLIMLVLVTCLVPGNVVRAEDCEEARKWYQRGLSLSDNSETEASYYQKAIELCPDYFEAHNRLGEVYKTWGEHELAVMEFKEASRSPSFAEPHHNLGEIYRMQGNYDLAVEEFKKAISIKPDFREAQNQLQYVLKRLGKPGLPIEVPPEEMPAEAPQGPIPIEERPGPVSIGARPGPAPVVARPGPPPIEARPEAISVEPRAEAIPVSIFSRIPGTTLPKGKFLVDFQYKYWSQKAGLEIDDVQLAADERESDVHLYIAGIRYGLTNNFTIGLMPRYFSRTAHVSTGFRVAPEGPGLQAEGEGRDADPEVSGFGDTVFLTKYRLWRKRMTHIALFHLLSIPTGDEDAEGEDGDVKRRIPLGSGSFDFAPGIALTTVKEPFTIHSDLWYVITDGRQAGDEFHFDLAAAFSRYHPFIPVMELNFRWADTTEKTVLYQRQLGMPDTPFGPPWSPSGGVALQTVEATVEEKGGETLFLSPGVQVYLPKGFKAEFGVQIPVIKPDDGWAEEVVFHVGLAKYFF